jgi:hypothetical protein
LVLVAELGACGSSESAGSAGTRDSGSSGSTSADAPVEASGGRADAGAFTGRSCGPGAPCTVGAKCSVSGLESGFDCECDPSRHFLCDGRASGGAPPFPTCNDTTACTAGPCQSDNGFCTRRCGCNAGCNVDCTGQGPATGPVLLCDLSYCALDYWKFGSCSVTDGSCSYTLVCNAGATPELTGSCP